MPALPSRLPSRLSSRPRSERERLAQEVLERATPVMSALGVLFLLVVLAERLAAPGSVLSTVMTVASWLLWAVFAAEFLIRMVIAPDTGVFWRRNWWQLLFLLLPFLRVLRLAHSVRMLRTGRVLSSVVRSTRSARRVLGGRIGWLAAASAIIVLGSGELLYEFGGYPSLGAALHAAALATVTGEPLNRPDAFSRVLEIVLAVYSVAVFATLAGSLGAYFLESRPAARSRPEADPPGRP